MGRIDLPRSVISYSILAGKPPPPVFDRMPYRTRPASHGHVATALFHPPPAAISLPTAIQSGCEGKEVAASLGMRTLIISPACLKAYECLARPL